MALIESSSGEIFKLLDDVHLNLSSFLVNLLGRFHDRYDILVNICRWKLTPVDILVFIGRNTQLTADVLIKFALLSNPKTPRETVRKLLRSIPESDIRHLLSNSYLPTQVKYAISELFPHIFF
jgi:hypothetical protein